MAHAMAAGHAPGTHDLGARRVAARPSLRVVGPSAVRPRPVRPVSAATYRRRRLLVAVVVLGVVLALRSVVGLLGGGTPPAPEPARLATRPVAAQVHVVQPGDTLWSVARSLEPDGDVRAVVDVLVDRYGTSLQPGQKIVLPAVP